MINIRAWPQLCNLTHAFLLDCVYTLGLVLAIKKHTKIGVGAGPEALNTILINNVFSQYHLFKLLDFDMLNAQSNHLLGKIYCLFLCIPSLLVFNTKARIINWYSLWFQYQGARGWQPSNYTGLCEKILAKSQTVVCRMTVSHFVQ